MDDDALDIVLDMSSFVMVHFSSSGFGDGVMARVCPSTRGALGIVPW